MTIKMDYDTKNMVKSALSLLFKSTISDLDKTNELRIVKGGFEIETDINRRIQVILEVKEVD